MKIKKLIGIPIPRSKYTGSLENESIKLKVEENTNIKLNNLYFELVKCVLCKRNCR